MMQTLSFERRKKFDACPDSLRLQRVAECQTQTKSGEFDCTFLNIDTMYFLEQAFQDTDTRFSPLISTTPVKNQTLVRLDEKYTGTTGGIENDFATLLQTVKPLPA